MSNNETTIALESFEERFEEAFYNNQELRGALACRFLGTDDFIRYRNSNGQGVLNEKFDEIMSIMSEDFIENEGHCEEIIMRCIGIYQSMN